MRTQTKTRYFANCDTLTELKKEYYKLAKQFHPDVSGSDTTEIFKQINNEYDLIFSLLKSRVDYTKDYSSDNNSDNNNNSDSDTNQQTNYTYKAETQDIFKDIISKIIHLPITFEICGYWLWLSGNTLQYKEIIKAAGFTWSRGKRMWYWKPFPNTRRYGKNTPMDKIRAKYGSRKIDSKYSGVN